MKHKLVTSKEDYIKFIVRVLRTQPRMGIEQIQSFLCIEFAYNNGKFPSDDQEDEWINNPVDYNNYRKIGSQPRLPKSYPCLLVYSFEHGSDRLGRFACYVLDFVYPKELELPKQTSSGCYCYMFEEQCDGVETIFITTEEFYKTNGYFSDRERGKEFPEAMKDLLVNVGEANFQPRKPYTKQDFINLADELGWKQVKS